MIRDSEVEKCADELSDYCSVPKKREGKSNEKKRERQDFSEAEPVICREVKTFLACSIILLQSLT